MNINDVKEGHELYYTAPGDVVGDHVLPSGWYTVHHIDTACNPPQIFIGSEYMGTVFEGYTFSGRLSVNAPPDPDEIPFEPEKDRLKVNPHYAAGSTLDPWEIMRQKFTPEEYRGYMKGNILKYLMRFDHKGTPLQDLRKIEDHVKELIKHYEDK